MVSKKDRIKTLLTENKGLFKCPVCEGKMNAKNADSLTCRAGHSFDLSRKGYVNLLTSSNAPIYSRELFEARHRVCETGFYDTLIESITEILDAYGISEQRQKLNILDAGCGEGSHLYHLYQKNKEKQLNTYIGIDISKDSISIAAGNQSDIIWCVADLARLPFRNKCMDVILNILSPANYGEFERVLNDKGIIIKVVPGPDYLKELRQALQGHKDVPDYNNSSVLDYFKQKTDVAEIRNIYFSFVVDPATLSDFFRMTPLTWGISTEELNGLHETEISSVTADLVLMIGRKKI